MKETAPTVISASTGFCVISISPRIEYESKEIQIQGWTLKMTRKADLRRLAVSVQRRDGTLLFDCGSTTWIGDNSIWLYDDVADVQTLIALLPAVDAEVRKFLASDDRAA